MREPDTSRETRVKPVLTNKHSQTSISPPRAPIDKIRIPGQEKTNIYIRYSPIRH
jgi:hypothetical protein